MYEIIAATATAQTIATIHTFSVGKYSEEREVRLIFWGNDSEYKM